MKNMYSIGQRCTGSAILLLLLLTSCSWISSDREWNNPYDLTGTQPAEPPVLESVPPDTVIIINDTLEMVASASSVNADVVAYRWSFDNGDTAIATKNGILDKVWAVGDTGTRMVTVSAVNQWDMVSKEKRFTVQVRSCYPVISEKLQDTSVRQLAEIERTFSATDSNGTITSYFWSTGTSGWDDSASGENAVTATFKNPQGGTLQIRWAARDDDGLMTYDTFNLIFNRRPQNARVTDPQEDEAAPFSFFDIVEGTGEIICSFTADDPDEGDTLTYTFFCGRSPEDTAVFYEGDNSSVRLSGIPASTVYQWTLLVKDLFGDTTYASGTFTTAPPPKAPEGMALVRARGTCFGMGQSGFRAAEEPIHQVCFSSHFWMDSTEVTFGDFAGVTGVDLAAGASPDLPVVNISWFDALLYCNARSKADGKDTVYVYTAQQGETGKKSVLEGLVISEEADGYRLPTEAQWEFACKADSLTLFFWGNDIAEASGYAWTKDNSSAMAHPVGLKRPNIWGLYDIAGNVWEWCQDWFDGGYYGASEWVDPPGPPAGVTRVIRGGSWSHSLYFAQAGTRASFAPGSADTTIGFRTVLIVR